MSGGPGLASGCPWKQKPAGPSCQSLQRVVEQGYVGRLEILGDRRRITAKPFWLVITTARFEVLHMVRAVWPNFIFMVFAPEAEPMSWWPRQMPNTGRRRRPESHRIASTA